MNTSRFDRKSFVIAGAAAVTLFSSPLLLNDYLGSGIAGAGIFSEAHAEAVGQGSHEGGAGGQRAGQGGPGAGGQGGQGGESGHRGEGGQGGISKVLEADDGSDSDRPVWAGGSKELNPHSGDSNPTPGIRKGDDYGDLWVLVRDPVTGAPILVDGEYQVCVDAACETPVLTVEGELPEGVVPLEVDLGRTNIVRSPASVTDKALDTVLAKLSDGTSVTTDAAGRLVIDGVTVDSPLENLALYIALMSDDPKLTNSIVNKLPGDALDLAASLLAAGADKTGEITVDLVVYQNLIMDITKSGEYYDYSDVDYDRSVYDVTYNYFYTSGDQVLSATLNLKDYLEATQPALNDATGITLFAIEADDALEVIELIHTQIQESLLPGTIQ